VTPGLVIGGISLVVLAIALFAVVSKKLAGGGVRCNVVTAVIAQFFNVLVLDCAVVYEDSRANAMRRRVRKRLSDHRRFVRWCLHRAWSCRGEEVQEPRAQ